MWRNYPLLRSWERPPKRDRPPRGGGRVTSSTAPAPCRGMDRSARQHLGRQAVPESRRPRWALHGLPARSWRADGIPTPIMTRKGRLFRCGRRARGGTAWLTNDVRFLPCRLPSPVRRLLICATSLGRASPFEDAFLTSNGEDYGTSLSLVDLHVIAVAFSEPTNAWANERDCGQIRNACSIC